MGLMYTSLNTMSRPKMPVLAVSKCCSCSWFSSRVLKLAELEGVLPVLMLFMLLVQEGAASGKVTTTTANLKAARNRQVSQDCRASLNFAAM